MEAPTNQPVRTCVGCRKRATKGELIRVVAGSDTNGPAVVADPRGTAAGRGAHLHPTTECHDLAVRRRVFPRALRHQGGLDTSGLRAWIDENQRLDENQPNVSNH